MAATEDEIVAERTALRTQTVQPFRRKRSSRKLFPEHLRRERVVIPTPQNCPSCGSAKVSKFDEEITRRWRRSKTVEGDPDGAITQLPAPFHAIPRGLPAERAHKPRV